MSQDLSAVYLEEAHLLLQAPNVSNRAKKLVNVYTEAISAHPEASAKPYLALAYFAYTARHYQDALRFLKEAMKIEPFHQPTQRLYKSIQHLQTTTEVRE